LPRAQDVTIEVGVQVGEDRALRFELLNPAQGVGDREMARVRPIPKCVDNPDVEVGQGLGRFRKELPSNVEPGFDGMTVSLAD
jgi:hypothetical protein